AEIDKCITYADALRDREIDARVVVKAIDREEIETGMRGPVEVRVDRVTHLVVADDIPEPAQDGAVEAIKSVQRDQGYKIVATGQQSADMLERIGELERDNMRLREMMNVASQRVSWSQRRELRVQREMRQMQVHQNHCLNKMVGGRFRFIMFYAFIGGFAYLLAVKINR
ncbi:hypothetical protein Tco_1078014, partial [Tanacetum coccineum]